MKINPLKITKYMNIVRAFENTVNNDTTYDSIAQIGDMAIDIMVNDNALDKIPVLGTIASIYKVTKNIQLLRLMKKVYKFIFLTKDTTLTERIEFIKEYTEISKEEGYEALLAVIDKLDNINKVDVIVNLMKAKIRGYIGIVDFIRLCNVIDRIPYPDFNELSKYIEEYYQAGSTDVLLSAGVLFNTTINGNENKYKLNHLGENLLRYGLLVDVSVDKQTYTRLGVLDWQKL